MTAKPRHLIHNFQELVTSTDINDRQSLHHAALLALGAAVLQGDTMAFGVVAGGLVTATGADRNVSVSSLLALRSGTPASAFDSSTQWIETTTTTTIDLTSFIDGANPRWVAIEVTDNQTAEAQQVVQIFNDVTKSFSGLLRDKVIAPTPTFSVRTGTAAANPVFPAGGVGVIPLAYVYLGAGAATVGATDIVMCRPMLRGDVGGDQPASGRDVWGGGVEVAAAGLDVVLRNAGGRHANHRTRWGIQALDGTTAYTLAAPGMDGAALPVADDVIYFYACPPPYPAGYDANLAPREHRPGATARTRYQGMVAPDLYNAVIVASVVEPTVTSPQGNPAAGNFTMTCAPFPAATTIDRSTAVYLGATFWDFSAGDILEQQIRGPWVQPAGITSLDALKGAGSYSLWTSNDGATDALLPITALSVLCNCFLRDNAQNSGTVMFVNITDEATQPVGIFWTFTVNPDVASATSAQNMQQHVFYVEQGTGNITIGTSGSDASDVIGFYCVAYDDVVLSMR